MRDKNKNYFDVKAEMNKVTFLQMCLSVVKGLIKITTIKIDKNMVGKEYKATIFFEKKEDK